MKEYVKKFIKETNTENTPFCRVVFKELKKDLILTSYIVEFSSIKLESKHLILRSPRWFEIPYSEIYSLERIPTKEIVELVNEEQWLLRCLIPSLDELAKLNVKSFLEKVKKTTNWKNAF